ncbi:MAG: L-serine ammonia-lyase, iron-sulfur-dependent, subunit alpha, partial [Clostridia bacterium]|nr:L-serine ammonia-lyase, iron-sulfur-dependent, subunit alpha [Clostridia bacterium]
AELLRYAETVPIEEIAFVGKAYEVNLALFHEGLSSPRTTFASALLAMNGGEVFSEDEKNTASLLCNTAIEARVLGLDKPAMSITGSGAHGIITTLPLYGVCKIHGFSEDRLYRATMLSYLVCTYIKEYSGRLSAFCGCAIAAGSGMACALCYLKGGGVRELEFTLNNMASSITGMICDGGNQGCTMKGVAACDAAFRAVDFALKGVHIDAVHGINGATPEETMRNMGLIASPGMVQTEKTIVEIFENKLK